MSYKRRTLLAFLAAMILVGSGGCEPPKEEVELDPLTISYYRRMRAMYDSEGDGKGPTFDFREVEFRDEDLERLGSLEGLKVLIFDGTKISDDGLDLLHGLKDLEELSLRDTRRTDLGKIVTDAGVNRLLEALPGVNVIRDETDR